MNGINLSYLASLRILRDNQDYSLILLLGYNKRIECKNIGFGYVLSYYEGSTMIHSTVYSSFTGNGQFLQNYLRYEKQVRKEQGIAESVLNALMENYTLNEEGKLVKRQ